MKDTQKTTNNTRERADQNLRLWLRFCIGMIVGMLVSWGITSCDTRVHVHSDHVIVRW